MPWSSALPMGTALEEGEAGEFNASRIEGCFVFTSWLKRVYDIF